MQVNVKRLLLLLIVLRELSFRADFVVNFEGSVSLAVIGAGALLLLIKPEILRF